MPVVETINLLSKQVCYRLGVKIKATGGLKCSDSPRLHASEAII